MAKWGEAKLTEEQKNAKEEERQRVQAEKAEREEAEMFNRQINFFIMRSMWQIVPVQYSNDTIEFTFNMSRARYSRIIDTGIARLSKDELEFLEKKTGVSSEIFKGEKRFDCLNKDGKEIITTEEWKELFKRRTKRRRLKSQLNEVEGTEDYIKSKIAYEEAKKIYKEAEVVIKEKLKDIPRKGNMDFQRFCTFAEKGYGSRLVRIQEIKQAISKIEFSLLDSCTGAELNDLSKLLGQKSKTVNAILQYRVARGDFRKNK